MARAGLLLLLLPLQQAQFRRPIRSPSSMQESSTSQTSLGSPLLLLRLHLLLVPGAAQASQLRPALLLAAQQQLQQKVASSRARAASSRSVAAAVVQQYQVPCLLLHCLQQSCGGSVQRLRCAGCRAARLLRHQLLEAPPSASRTTCSSSMQELNRSVVLHIARAVPQLLHRLQSLLPWRAKHEAARVQDLGHQRRLQQGQTGLVVRDQEAEHQRAEEMLLKLQHGKAPPPPTKQQVLLAAAVASSQTQWCCWMMRMRMQGLMM